LPASISGFSTLIGILSVWSACSSSSADDGGYSKVSGGMGGAVNGSNTTGADGSGGTGPAFVTSSTTGTITVNVPPEKPVDACEADASTAEAVGLDMYIVFDRSGSMAEIPGTQNAQNPNNQVRWPDPDGYLGDCPVDTDAATGPMEQSKWCLATNALADFFAAPTQEDVRAAFQFMTPSQEGFDICGAEAGNLHATAAVPYTQLPVVATDALVTTLDSGFPAPPAQEAPDEINAEDIGTRIEAALHGIAMYTAANADPLRKTIGVLVTDGQPYNCERMDIDALGQIAADHYAATGIATFIIGMTGAVADQLEILAANAGGPEHGPEFCDADAGHETCHYWSVGDGNSSAFTQALAEIQSSVFISCEYSIPIPQGGDQLNPELVQVTYDDGMGNLLPVSKVDNEAACTATGTGWYYDNPADPTSILLCPTNCSTVSDAPSGAKVEILYGCSEIVQ
jgi:hypothetical protein